jgi:hypothetical protein
MAQMVLWLIASLLFVLVLSAQVDRAFNIPLRPFALSRSGLVCSRCFRRRHGSARAR